MAAQVALSLVLLVAAGLFLRSFAKLALLDIGFDRNNVLMVSTNLKAANVPPDQRAAIYGDIESRLRSLPGVVSAGRSWSTPISGGTWDQNLQADSPNPPTGEASDTYLNSISPTYFKTLRTPILAGRDFNDRDTTTSPWVAIVNQTLANKFYPGLNPIGRYFRTEGPPGKVAPPIEIVGVVKDSKYDSLREKAHPTAFFPLAQQAPDRDNAENFELRTAVPPSTLISAVQGAAAGVNKEISIDFRTLAEQVNDSLVEERMLALLSGFFGGLALLLAMVGLYGTLSYLVTQRQAEFGSAWRWVRSHAQSCALCCGMWWWFSQEVWRWEPDFTCHRASASEYAVRTRRARSGDVDGGSGYALRRSYHCSLPARSSCDKGRSHGSAAV